MSAPNHPARPPRAGARRLRYGLSTAVLLIAATMVCVLGATLAPRLGLRWDVTSTRSHTLSPRTTAVLRGLASPTTIVVSLDAQAVDPQSQTLLRDLLTRFERVSPFLRTTWIDTSSLSGPARFAALLAELCAQDDAPIQAARAGIQEAAAAASELPGALTGVSDGLKALARLMPAPDELERQAGLVRTVASRLEPVGAGLLSDAQNKVAGAAIPALDSARERTGPLDEAARVLAAVSDFALALSGSSKDPGIIEASRALEAQAGLARDSAARAAAVLGALKTPDALIVARVLQADNAVLVNGPAGTVPIDFASVFPGGSSGGASAGDTLFAGESLLTTALAALSDEAAPIAAFVHAENGQLLDSSGVSPAGMRAYGALFDRLRLARIDPAEWAVARATTRPLMRDTTRPVVWIVLGAPSRAGVDPRQPSQNAERSARLTKLAQAAQSLINEGQNVLMCADASDLPGVGEADPLAAALAPLGLRVQTGFPLMRRESTPRGPATFLYQVIRDSEPSHPIAGAIHGLATVLPWACPLDIEPATGVRAWPLLRVPESARAWGESQWIRLREIVARGGTGPLDALLLADPPAPDQGRDRLRPEGDPASGWTVAAAAERTRAGAERAQRVVVVSSPAWFDNAYTQQADVVAGRRALLFPGNLELLDASLRWLAGQDERIAPGPQSQDVPRVGPIAPGALVALRWTLVAGLPALVLIAGALWRVAHG